MSDKKFGLSVDDIIAEFDRKKSEPSAQQNSIEEETAHNEQRLSENGEYIPLHMKPAPTEESASDNADNNSVDNITDSNIIIDNSDMETNSAEKTDKAASSDEAAIGISEGKDLVSEGAVITSEGDITESNNSDKNSHTETDSSHTFSDAVNAFKGSSKDKEEKSSDNDITDSNIDEIISDEEINEVQEPEFDPTPEKILSGVLPVADFAGAKDISGAFPTVANSGADFENEDEGDTVSVPAPDVSVWSDLSPELTELAADVIDEDGEELEEDEISDSDSDISQTDPDTSDTPDDDEIIEDDLPETDDTDDSSPKGQTAPTGKTNPKEQTTPTEEATPTEQTAPTEKTNPTEEAKPTEEAAPTEEQSGESLTSNDITSFDIPPFNPEPISLSEKEALEDSSLGKKEKKSFIKELLPWKGDSVFEIIRKVIFLIAVIIFIGAGIMLATTLIDSDKAVKDLEEIKEIVTTTVKTTIDSEGSVVTIPPTEEEEKQHNIDIMSYYKDISENVVGFIELEGCDIYQPVVQKPEDTKNEYYLTHTYYDEVNKGGAIFMDYRCTISEDYVSPNIVLYGHNQEDGTMFGNLHKYKQGPEFYAENPTVTLRTEYETGTYLIYAYFVTNALAKQDSNGVVFHYHDYIETLSDESTFDWYMKEVQSRNMIVSPVKAQYGDKLLVLSTCSNEFSNSRFVVFARKLREGESVSDYDFGDAYWNGDARGVDWTAILSGETTTVPEDEADSDETSKKKKKKKKVYVTDENGEIVTDENGERVTTVIVVEVEETEETSKKKKKKKVYVTDENGEIVTDENGERVTTVITVEPEETEPDSEGEETSSKKKKTATTAPDEDGEGEDTSSKKKKTTTTAPDEDGEGEDTSSKKKKTTTTAPDEDGEGEDTSSKKKKTTTTAPDEDGEGEETSSKKKKKTTTASEEESESTSEESESSSEESSESSESTAEADD